MQTHTIVTYEFYVNKKKAFSKSGSKINLSLCVFGIQSEA